MSGTTFAATTGPSSIKSNLPWKNTWSSGKQIYALSIWHGWDGGDINTKAISDEAARIIAWE
jgi:hypothetical protein